jgi:hypothetical protein
MYMMPWDTSTTFIEHEQAGRNAFHAIDWPGLQPGFVLKGLDGAPHRMRSGGKSGVVLRLVSG